MTENKTLNVMYHDVLVGRLAETPDKSVEF